MLQTNTVDAVDLSAFATTESHALEILTPDGRPSGWKVTLGAPSHPKATAYNDAAAKRNLHRAKMIEQAQINGRKYVSEEKTPEEARAENVAWVVSRIIAWTPVKIAGETIVFSDEAATKLLVRPELGFAFGQILKAVADEKRFMPRSATP